jgi:hypothetical protein
VPPKSEIAKWRIAPVPWLPPVGKLFAKMVTISPKPIVTMAR